MEGILQMRYQCPVCGYDQLTHPPEDYTICPCCMTEFGNDDLDYTIEELRAQWVNNGLQWHSRVVARPRDWDPIRQLGRLLNPTPIVASVSQTETGIAQTTRTIYVREPTQIEYLLVRLPSTDDLVPVHSGSTADLSVGYSYA